MYMKRNAMNWLGRPFVGVFLLSLMLAFAVSCDENNASSEVGEYIPEAPDYTDDTMWFTQENDATGQGADVFYLVSTWEVDWETADGRVCHYADVHNPEHRADMDKEISRIAGYMGLGNNFYSPYYRHTTIEAWETQNEDTISRRYQLAFEDVRSAFETFLKQREPERPFILAGFSQGAKSVVELLKVMPEELHRYLVAAYVMGYRVTPEDVASTPNIQAAQDSTDLGVTICYNSVSDVQYIKPVVSVPCAMCINPVNWRTDATPATLQDTITVSVSPEHHVLVVKGFSGAGYPPIRGFLNVGDYHGAEPWLYEECLRENIQARIRAYYNRYR